MALCHWSTGSKMTGQAALPHRNIHTRLINNKITQWLGRYSFEIYMSQGFFLLLRRGSIVVIDNTYMFIIITTAGTFIVAMLMKSFYERNTNFGERY